jgi:hypothetical protein
MVSDVARVILICALDPVTFVFGVARETLGDDISGLVWLPNHRKRSAGGRVGPCKLKERKARDQHKCKSHDWKHAINEQIEDRGKYM